MLRYLSLPLLCAVWLLAPAPARAEWREAVTRHFIIYSEGSDASLRKAAEDLEKYDYLLRLMLDVPSEAPVKLKIYLMRDVGEVQETMGYGKDTGVAGYYTGSPRGSIAVSSRKDSGKSDYDLSSEVILLHEYAHHLMLQHFAVIYPSWYVEGFAEYYGTTQILPNNVIEVGHPARHRAISFNGDSDWIPLGKLLSARTYKDIDNKVWLLYAQGWLLVHYLNNNPERAGQLRKFLTAINNGVDRKTAMDDAFGPGATELDKELRRYSRRQRLEGTRITFPAIDIGEIRTRTLRPAESALIRHDLALTRGVFARNVAEFAAEVRKIAAAHPDDPYAAGIVAEAEHLAGNVAASEAATERWLKLEPGAPRALALRSTIAVGKLAPAKSADAAAWEAARKWVADARKAAPTDPYVLEAYYDSFAAAGAIPPAKAQNALFKALQLVPRDERLRYKVALDFERRGMIEPAIAAIRPAAFGGHDPEGESEKQKAKRLKLEEKWRFAGEVKTETPREMLARLEAKLGGTDTAAASTAK